MVEWLALSTSDHKAPGSNPTSGSEFKWALRFPTFILCCYFFLLFSENALLSLLFSPKMFEVTKNNNFFLHLLGVGKNQINSSHVAELYKIFLLSCNSFFGTIFWYFFSMVMQC